MLRRFRCVQIFLGTFSWSVGTTVPSHTLESVLVSSLGDHLSIVRGTFFPLLL